MKRCILHVGHPKTASTYLQTTIHLNQDLLGAAGFSVPSDFTEFGSYDFRQLAEAGRIFSGNLQTVFEAYEANQAERVNQLLHHILRSGARNLILSSELLFYYVYVVGDIVRRAANSGYEVLVVAYVARQDRAAISDYTQNIRNHDVSGTVVEFLETKRREKHLKYVEVLDSYSVSPPHRVIVRTFDRQFLLGGDLVSDFLSIAGCPVNLKDIQRPPTHVNAGLPVEWCEIMRGLNLARAPERTIIRDAHPEFSGRERARVMAHYFREEVRDYVLQEYFSGNRAFVETYLADRSDEEKRYWLQPPSSVTDGVELDAEQLAECLNLLRFPAELVPAELGSIEERARSEQGG